MDQFPQIASASQNALTWVRQHLVQLLITCVVVSAVSGLVFVLVSHQASKVLHQATLPKKQVKSLLIAAKKDSAQAVTYQLIARVSHQQADSALAAARTQTNQANVFHAKANLLPPAARGPISAIEFDLRAYQSPDTAR